MLRAYRNLSFKASSVDARGRLTGDDIHRVLMRLEDSGVHGVSVDNLDIALSDGLSSRVFDVMIPIRNGELPSPDDSISDSVLVGFMYGHVASSVDMVALSHAKPPLKLMRMFPVVERGLRAAKRVVIIDGMVNCSRYNDAVMLAFLLRKYQESPNAGDATVYCYPGTVIDGKSGGEMIKFGFKPFAACDYDRMDPPAPRNGKTALMVAFKVRDTREGRDE